MKYLYIVLFMAVLVVTFCSATPAALEEQISAATDGRATAELSNVVTTDEKKNEKRGIYGFGYGHHGGFYGGYGHSGFGHSGFGHSGFGHGGHFGGYPYFSGYYAHAPSFGPSYYPHHGYYHHGFH